MGHPTRDESGQELYIVDEIEQPACGKQKWRLDGEPRNSHDLFSRMKFDQSHNMKNGANFWQSRDLEIITPMGYLHSIALGRTPAILRLESKFQCR